jgi:hypothetical protein
MVRVLRVLLGVLKDHDAALANLAAVQKRCGEIETERRVLSIALDLAIKALPIDNTKAEEDRARALILERARAELAR